MSRFNDEIILDALKMYKRYLDDMIFWGGYSFVSEKARELKGKDDTYEYLSQIKDDLREFTNKYRTITSEISKIESRLSKYAVYRNKQSEGVENDK